MVFCVPPVIGTRLNRIVRINATISERLNAERMYAFSIKNVSSFFFIFRLSEMYTIRSFTRQNVKCKQLNATS